MRARLIVLCLVLTMNLGAQDYPRIEYTIVARDALYAQQQQDVEDWYRGEDVPLSLYLYVPRPSEDLFSVAAAFNLPYESVASFNGWDSPSLLRRNDPILIPNSPGLFVPESPQNSWDRLLQATDRIQGQTIALHRSDGTTIQGQYFQGERFTPEERRRFLGSLFGNPISGEITSPFGYRPDPFTGRRSFHPGVDIRGDIGSPIRAARGGTVVETGTLETYGLFIIMSHDGGYQTVYGHLSQVLVGVGQDKEAGDIIALSGNSGISTGPHLHFEIRRDGTPINPSGLVNLGQ